VGIADRFTRLTDDPRAGRLDPVEDHMRVLVALLCLLFVGPAVANSLSPDAWTLSRSTYATAKLATMRMGVPEGTCSATAVGQHLVLTAEHCIQTEIGLNLAGISFDGRAANITGVDRDGNDHVLLHTDIAFAHWAKLGPRPAQGDDVFVHGNPDSYPDILLIGHVAGWVHNYHDKPEVMVVDLNCWYGCSGGGVFDSQGRVVGVVSVIFPWPNQGWRLTGCLPIAFTEQQLHS